ncbi:MAG: hypothetical protein ACOX1U_00460 [Saccharofermentanales bacterium]|jgi:hypothetical protein|nr:hypothetical protein [Clostridiaceae bacterium]
MMAAKTTSKNQSTRTTPTGARRSRRRKSTFFSFLELVALTFWGRIFLVLLIIAFVALINIAISKNQYDLFFRLTGIELVLVAVFFWLRFLLRKN